MRTAASRTEKASKGAAAGVARIAAAALVVLVAPPSEALLLRPLRLTTQSYGESFTFIADLDDGTYVHVQLAITNLGPGSARGVCRVLVASPGRDPWKADARVGKEGWSYQPGLDERLSIGRCAATIAGESMRVDASVGGGSVHLAFPSRPRLVSPPDHLLSIGREHYQTEILYLRIPVEAQLAIPGEPPRTVSGGGYSDHSRSDVSPKALATRWVRFRALRENPGFLLLGRESAEGRFVPLWESRSPNRFVSCSRFNLERDGTRRLPSFRVEVACPDDRLEIRSMQLLYRDAPVEELGLLGRMLAPVVGSPVTYVYRGRLTERDGAQRDGILEVEVEGD